MTDPTPETPVAPRAAAGAAPVAAIIPVFDNAPYVAEAIESVLGQTRPPAECIVVDDGSTDASAAIARNYAPAVRVISTGNNGPSAARNVGIDASSQPWIAICDADDLWLPERLERQLDAAAANPAIGALFTWINEFVSPELASAGIASGTRAPMDVAIGPLPSSLLVRRTVADRAGRFDESLRVGDWVEWYTRLVATGTPVHTVDEVLVRRRHHATNNSNREAAHKAEMVRSMKAHLDRIRKASP